MKLKHMFIGVVATFVMAPTLASAQAGLPRSTPISTAGPNDVRVYATYTVAPQLEAVKAEAEKLLGKKIIFQYGSARGNLHDAIAMGNGEFEVAILLPDVHEKLWAAGKIKPGSHEIARAPVAFAVRGAATVDVSNPEAVKKTLLGASSVEYAPTGAALMTVRKVLGDLQIADKVKDGSAIREPVQLTGDQYEMNIFPISEIVVNNQVRNLGPVIKELQVPAIVEATVGANTRDEAAARALIKFLQGPAIDPALKAGYLDKGVIRN